MPLFRLPEIAFENAHDYLNSDSVKGKLECQIPIIQYFDSKREHVLGTMVYVRDDEESEWSLVHPIGRYEGLTGA